MSSSSTVEEWLGRFSNHDGNAKENIIYKREFPLSEATLQFVHFMQSINNNIHNSICPYSINQLILFDQIIIKCLI